MKKRFLWITIFFIIGAVYIYFITIPKVEKWIYNLPNNYVIEKKSDTKVVIGKYIDGTLELKIDNQVSIDDYIAEFSYSKNYVTLKCVESINNNIAVKFYIIDTKNHNIYGPYLDEETYNLVADEIVDEKLGDWIKTIARPKGAINK